jgi:hypothetical protein
MEAMTARGGDGGETTCPYCRESIKAGAVKCKHCLSVIEWDAIARMSGGGSGGLGEIDFPCLEECAIKHLGDVDAFIECAKACGLKTPGGFLPIIRAAQLGARLQA